MLYPLSYEGLRCTFPSMAGESWFVGLGLAASLQTVWVAPVPRAVNQLIHYRPDTRRRLYGEQCRARSRRSTEQTR